MRAGDLDAAREIVSAAAQKYSNDETESEEEYKNPITQKDITTLRSIGRKSVNEFSTADIQKTKKWAVSETSSKSKMKFCIASM